MRSLLSRGRFLVKLSLAKTLEQTADNANCTPAILYANQQTFERDALGTGWYLVFPAISPCPDQGSQVQLVVAVTSDPSHPEHRRAIRETFAAKSHLASYNAVLLFFLGSNPGRSDLMRAVEREASEHEDIVQESFYDVPENLALKTVAILKFVALHCPKSEFVLKSTDDTFINIHTLLHALQHTRLLHTTFVLGHVMRSLTPIRDNSLSWWVRELFYPHWRVPDFVEGHAYSLTSSAAAHIYKTSLRQPILVHEDVYVTGFCAAKAHVTVMHHAGFTNDEICSDSACGLSHRFSCRSDSPSHMTETYEEMEREAGALCFPPPSGLFLVVCGLVLLTLAFVVCKEAQTRCRGRSTVCGESDLLSAQFDKRLV
ncbi:beta-1,3-galactosyltransferase 1-like [Aplysia californica]|uniref:Hexosyltransferase n=1 Tax=Aplysia californica TaxID=6500 RepID=A0ABM1ADN7_APLCA|nr:beta-1,3-galactosyltransferase 1-like [Aplysia californica]